MESIRLSSEPTTAQKEAGALLALSRLTARVAALEAALRPFAEGLGAVQRFVPGAPEAWTLGQEVVRHTGITYGDLRRACATLEASEPQPLTAAPTTTS
jgi:hypothetical protein